MHIPSEIRKRLEQEEKAYWRIRDSLLDQYAGKFVAIVNGQVVASGDKMGPVSAEAYRKTGSRVKFVTLVGEENFEFVIRQISGYFAGTGRFDLPVIQATVSDIDRERQE